MSTVPTENAAPEAVAKKTRKPRTPRTLSPVEREAADALALAKNKSKETKAIVKISSEIAKLSAWGIEKVNEAVSARQTALSATVQ